MSFFVTCTFDLKNASRTDYDAAYADLAKLGLTKVVVSDQGNQVVVPTTMTMGTFDGASAQAVSTAIRDRVQAAFRARRFSSEIFVIAASNWAWSSARTP